MALAWAAALAVGGCGGFNRSAVSTRFPELRRFEPHRLGDVHPYVLPAAGQVALFLCRWPTDAPIPVALPIGASAEERSALEAALRAWQGAGLGLRFLPVDADVDAPIQVILEDGAVVTGGGQDSGNAVVDCRITPLSQQPAEGAVAGATLARATLRIARRTHEDLRGSERELAPSELAGTLLHELGHAIGFQGHASHGETIMVRETEKVRRTGKGLLAREPFEDSTLRALYAVPSGAVISRTPVEPWRTDLVDRMARLAEQEQLDGPFVRVGETAARIFWRDAQGREYGLMVPKLAQTLNDPRKVLVIPEPRVRRALPRSEDLGPAPASR